MKRKPYINDNEFAEDNFSDFYEPHTEPHPFRLTDISKIDKKKVSKTKQEDENI